MKEGGVCLSYKFRLYPTPTQERYLEENFRACRFVYNHFLGERIKAYNRTRPTLKEKAPNPAFDPEGDPAIPHYITVERENPAFDPDARPMTFYDTSKALTALKKQAVDAQGRLWLKRVDSTALVYALRHLDAAYQNFFRRVQQGANPGFPKFKSKNDSKQSFTTGNVKVADGAVVLPKVGRVKCRTHREVRGEVVAGTVSRNATGQYYIAIKVKDAPVEPLPEGAGEVGVSMGTRTWVATSDGERFDNPQTAKKYAKKLAREQKRLARKQPGSANYEKQKRKVAAVHQKVASSRADATHKMTRAIVDSHDVIASRDVSVDDMVRDVGEALPAKARRRVNRAIEDANFAEINRQLAYKSEWAGRTFVLVDADAPTAQVCSVCGHRNEEVAGDARREWTCPACGAVHDRSCNGAANVLAAGLDKLAGTEESPVTREMMADRKRRAERERRRRQGGGEPQGGA